MSQYRVVCTEQTRCSTGGHILKVGTGVPDAASTSWTVQEVWNAIDRGHTFYTHANGYTATVEKYRCACGLGSLRSSRDATVANNLDNLRLCHWKAA